ncbi:hypothetical protein [Kitasatospora sp. MAP5-34]|uniref:hypothetical protein n=1 Tax=Kitasatospora sp. MAP5-34 TaxID=3035102 RepID=UPI0024768E53|nr:hypothetical protein [Kitasatospora sp. MAP5-34]MDH6580689.1 hypothetical protein [Kitasatospora sp. MAP5-34]
MAETQALIDWATTAFRDRHGRPMPEDNVWLLQRRAEHAALTRLLDMIRAKPGRAARVAQATGVRLRHRPLPGLSLLPSISTLTEGPGPD